MFFHPCVLKQKKQEVNFFQSRSFIHLFRLFTFPIQIVFFLYDRSTSAKKTPIYTQTR
jgi:hypothetical protein